MNVAAATPETTAEFTLDDLGGRWRSPYAPEVFPGIFGIDDFWLQSPFWGIHFNSYADPECRNRLFELIIMGTFALLGPSPITPGARDADFSRVKVALRLFEPGLVATADEVGSGDGHWVAGEWQDVSVGGCAPLDLPGVDECPREYDLLGMVRADTPESADRLYFGQRHHDEQGSIWTRRAPGLLDYHVVRVGATPPDVGHGAEWGPAEWTRLTSTYTLRQPNRARHERSEP